MIFGRATFAGAAADFESAVRARDRLASEQAFDRLQRTFQGADEAGLVAAAPRLAALLPEVPTGPRATVAVVVGACVERGADALVCAAAVLAGVGETLASAEEFIDRWAATGGGELPDPGQGALGEAVFARVGPEAAHAWWTLPQWEMAAVAVLNRRAARDALTGRGQLVSSARRVAAAVDGGLKYLVYALLVLDDEPLVVLHRSSGTGYRLRMTGLGDNFQLHTLLAAELIGGGHVSGRAPTAEAVAVCRDAPGQVHTIGSFNFAAPDGSWIRNEGTPAEIPAVDGVRLLVLDAPPYESSWPAGRFFPGMPGGLVLEHVMAPAEAADRLAKVSDAKG
jgi:hypothetical protein